MGWTGLNEGFVFVGQKVDVWTMTEKKEVQALLW